MKKHLSVTFLFIIFLIIPLYVKAQEPFQCDTPDYGKAGSKERCGVRGTDNLTIECDPADGELVCSSNEFNTCKTRVCLVGVGGKCGNNSICEGGSVCNIPSGQSEGRCDTSPDDDTASSSDLRDTIRRILNVILGFLGIITVVMVIYGGFMWLTAAGNDDNVAKGRHTLLWAALGAILIGIAWTVSSYILSVAEKVG
ncbi:MAG: hypothetical protein A3H61_01355 [Candidatus Jacksonbacteria bacterium RIFCSPLOWO2_02_FULL_44_20]|uniref:Uncharacterized protein n=1 Tax=Candidatus Jacksonbacteria bacterium RIFCSPLOWO2_02_FULL_44_20 TaxID=1798460 RepID=A0A1G2ABJ4_9BACT|nr:MAG: hypothetical protein A3H61_01355 [Candidatus Jacksonbacteria bacterium RIFCSPLOWO2_02_FULL_44_20]HCA66930.1 hypothetical protein [Candidatus Jacksonbacteria bacterium]